MAASRASIVGRSSRKGSPNRRILYAISYKVNNLLVSDLPSFNTTFLILCQRCLSWTSPSPLIQLKPAPSISSFIACCDGNHQGNASRACQTADCCECTLAILPSAPDPLTRRPPGLSASKQPLIVLELGSGSPPPPSFTKIPWSRFEWCYKAIRDVTRKYAAPTSASTAQDSGGGPPDVRRGPSLAKT